MSEMLFEIRIESEIIYYIKTPNTGNAVPELFVDKTIGDEDHCKNIKSFIKNNIINHLKECPTDYMNEKGEYQYHHDTYDFADNVDVYIGKLYEDQNETKTFWVCPDCNSDNVQFKIWTDANTMKATNDECPMEDQDCFCKDCESTSLLIRKTMIPRKKVIGFQVVGVEGSKEEGNIHPDMKTSSCLYNLNNANKMIDNDNNGKESWKLLTIWSDDIEEPIIMFEGNVR